MSFMKPWKTFELATGRMAEMNRRVRDQALLKVERFQWPEKVILGEYWLEERPEARPTSFWFGDFGINMEVEIVPGDRLEVI